MKKIAIVLLSCISTFSFAKGYSYNSSSSYSGSSTHVSGYTRHDGTYVQPHYRSSPNQTQRDNYGTIGNTNPYTGKSGTREAAY